MGVGILRDFKEKLLARFDVCSWPRACPYDEKVRRQGIVSKSTRMTLRSMPLHSDVT